LSAQAACISALRPMQVRWHGTTFEARPLRPCDDGSGDWLMQALGHAPRVASGTIVRVQQSEIVSQEDFAAILRAVPGEEAMSVNSLADKMQAAAGAAADLAASMEAQADALIAKRAQIENRSRQVFAQHNAVLDMASKGLDSLEAALAPISNAAL